MPFQYSIAHNMVSQGLEHFPGKWEICVSGPLQPEEFEYVLLSKMPNHATESATAVLFSIRPAVAEPMCSRGQD